MYKSLDYPILKKNINISEGYLIHYAKRYREFEELEDKIIHIPYTDNSFDKTINNTIQFKDRLKKSLDGHTSTGNSQDAGNVIKSDLGKNIAKKVERKQKQRKDMVMYNKDVSPTKEVNESKNSLSSILEEEIKKMKNIASYDKKTQ